MQSKRFFCTTFQKDPKSDYYGKAISTCFIKGANAADGYIQEKGGCFLSENDQGVSNMDYSINSLEVC
jgi:hypothetical protein